MIVTAVETLDTVLADLRRAAAAHGWQVQTPSDAAGLQSRARAAVAELRLPQPVLVRVVPAGAGGGGERVDAEAMLRRSPVDGAVADVPRRRTV